MTLLWWHWLVLGLLLGVAEVATAGGFFVMFFAVAALVVGAKLDFIDREGIKRIVNLGDLVGYGPDPRACFESSSASAWGCS